MCATYFHFGQIYGRSSSYVGSFILFIFGAVMPSVFSNSEQSFLADNRRMFIFLFVLVIAAAIGFQGWRTLYNNFAVELAGLTGEQNGFVQSLREVPGFLALLAIYLLYIIQEHKLAGLSILVLGVGVSLTGLFPSYMGMLCTTLIMSFGFHYFETMSQSLTLQYFSKQQAPVVMGRLRGFASGANLVVGVFVFLAAGYLEYKTMFFLFGAVVIVAGVWCLLQNPTSPDVPAQQKKIILRKRYSLFYLLTFLAGARRQVFVAFAVFLLVQKFQFSVQEITALFILNNIINWFLSPAIGKAVARYGERKVLSLEYAALVFVFVGYAFVESKLLMVSLYILDHIFFNFALALKTYYQKIADPQDISPGMAVSFSINHIAAVVIPAAGGILWMVDYRIPFLGAAGLSVLSLVAVQCIQTSNAR